MVQFVVQFMVQFIAVVYRTVYLYSVSYMYKEMNFAP